MDVDFFVIVSIHALSAFSSGMSTNLCQSHWEE
jgi:hypothetical protein